jgi:hypothetical protein
MKTAHSLGVIGKLTFAPTDPPRPLATYVIQRVPPGTGNVMGSPDRSLQIRLHVVGENPNTPAQQANREKFAAGVVIWHTFDSDTKKEWTRRGHGRGISGFNAFMSQTMKAV